MKCLKKKKNIIKNIVYKIYKLAQKFINIITN